jgi:hypothetical protein
MSVKCEPQFPWTAKEDEIIRRHYPKGGPGACYPRLRRYHRTVNAIYQRALKLGFRKSRAADLHEGEGK